MTKPSLSVALPVSLQTDQILECISTEPNPVPDCDVSTLEQGLAVVICTYRRPESLRRCLDSLATQTRKPTQLIIVDASPDHDTEEMVRKYSGAENLAERFLYFHLAGSLRGLTRQRNFAVRWVTVELVAFFDDDILLMPDSLREMEKVHCTRGAQVAGVGALIQGYSRQPTRRWRLMRSLRMISTLRPGGYERSGISIPWSFLSETEELVEGEWLPGGATMWRTNVAREVGFCEDFEGYAQGEDLDFSLRARGKGKLLLTQAAQVRHLDQPSTRPDPYSWGYMEIFNRFRIHRRALTSRSWMDVVWFIYAWTLDTLLIARDLFYPRSSIWTLKRIAGRFKATCDILWRWLTSR